jgi:hypothetical protein
MIVQSLVLPAKPVEDQSMLELDLLSNQELAHRCAQEVTQYRAGGRSDERYGRALFRRAIARHDDDAWECIYRQFAPLALTWISNHPQATHILEYDSYDSVVNAAFAKFSQAITPAKIDTFLSLASLLTYLKHCVRSAIMDTLRSQQAYRLEDTLDLIDNEPVAGDPAEYVMGQLTIGDVWQVVQRMLKDEKERVCVTLMYMYDMRPDEIHHTHRRLFPTVDEVYRVKHNLFARLRRNSLLKAMWMCSL